MSDTTRGFVGRRRDRSDDLPPGQHLTDRFPVLSTGPTPRVRTEEWELIIRSSDTSMRWSWQEFMDLRVTTIVTDIHCVTSWSKLGTRWRGVSLDVLLADVPTTDRYVMAHSYGGYTTNHALDDLRGGKAWIAFEYDGRPLTPEHGGPARLLVPHLYFWKSAKWIHGFVTQERNDPGLWERNGYHLRGDPWREERYARWS
ncbi:molybdopterin-dependent oxidoreductase [Microlunatus sp. Gsoil 973]|uniref:molybdopterin-dependent oxidoreductase n=1 Tax=Microlunatus sp. Gsoil 973 TaxID=2672569 RepID=UPI0012B5005D|nr:molybdopterin-dependent oxidoreductase [Microlunatus sp. Gsoil 973]QGN33226.1 molybdopterin-dependent oxidoreductase [Microlunatus sp. Gsoil 973]